MRRCGCGYLIAAAACGVFGFAYEQFSHGVYSECMLLFFLIPLLGGALPSFLLLSARRAPGRTTRCLWACAMDALTVQEETELPFASENPGVMHACGHDCHISTLLTAARVLNDMKADLCGTVRLAFQPAEETAQGAKAMGEVEFISLIFSR